MSEPTADHEYLYSFGRRRHIADPHQPPGGCGYYRLSLCGDRYMTDGEMSERGPYTPALARRFPVCKHCDRAAAPHDTDDQP